MGPESVRVCVRVWLSVSVAVGQDGVRLTEGVGDRVWLWVVDKAVETDPVKLRLVVRLGEGLEVRVGLGLGSVGVGLLLSGLNVLVAQQERL